MSENIKLGTKLVGEIEGKFLVKSYQRGYRWSKDEVIRLLEDIKQNENKYHKNFEYTANIPLNSFGKELINVLVNIELVLASMLKKENSTLLLKHSQNKI